MPNLSTPCRRARRDTQNQVWFIQFRVQMRKLRLPEDRDTSRAGSGQRGSSDPKWPRPKPNGSQTWSRASLLIMKPKGSGVRTRGQNARSGDPTKAQLESTFPCRARKHTQESSQMLVECRFASRDEVKAKWISHGSMGPPNWKGSLYQNP